MRLSKSYIKAIKENLKIVFGQDAQVFLFGSRVDDNQKGGDIDLYIKINDKTDLFLKKIRFLAKLKMIIGEQKIDVIFNEDPNRLIEKEAEKTCIAL